MQKKSNSARSHGLQTIFLMQPPGPFGSSPPRTEFCKICRLALAIYQLLDGGAMNSYEDWLADNWLPVSAPLSSQRISELLAQVDHEGMVNYFRMRFDRPKENGLREYNRRRRKKARTCRLQHCKKCIWRWTLRR